MKNILITGHSSGFGYELSKIFTEKGYNVVGISRSISDSVDTNIQCDFSDLENINQIEIPKLDYEYVILNAGILGEIKKNIDISIEEYTQVFNINFFSNKIILDKLFSSNKEIKNVIGISSGAAHKTYFGWSQYCSSKSAFKQLISSYSDEYTDSKFISLSPGIMKTKMQDKIFNVDEIDFPSVSKFKKLYVNGMETPLKIANKFVKNIDNILEENNSGSFFDMRDIE